ncbi:hypothetical protein QE152_g10063 [Popillia japonica]|uniref:Uncharacterized protein n=1 Tax=Popillia japonica TaxID=7064 RepID=A0AAW1LWN0_POPJA
MGSSKISSREGAYTGTLLLISDGDSAVYLSTPVNHAYTPNKGGEEVSENEPDAFINNYLTGGFPSADESIPEVSD